MSVENGEEGSSEGNRITQSRVRLIRISPENIQTELVSETPGGRMPQMSDETRTHGRRMNDGASPLVPEETGSHGMETGDGSSSDSNKTKSSTANPQEEKKLTTVWIISSFS